MLSSVEGWLKNGRPHGTTIEAVELEPPKLAKGESGLLDQIENRRRRVRELRADLARIEAAPFPSSFAKQRMREQVEQLAMRAAPNVAALIEHQDGKLEFPRQLARAQVHNVANSPAATAYFELIDPAGLLAWMFKDQMIAALDREIASESDDKAALSPDDRQRKEAVLFGDLLSVERDEAMLTWQAQAQNLPCEHRSDCSPLALLGLRLVATSKRPAPATSGAHAFDLAGR